MAGPRTKSVASCVAPRAHDVLKVPVLEDKIDILAAVRALSTRGERDPLLESFELQRMGRELYLQNYLQHALAMFERALQVLDGAATTPLDISPKTYQERNREPPINVAPEFARFRPDIATRAELASSAAIGAANIYVAQRQYAAAADYFQIAQSCDVDAELVALDRTWAAIKQRKWSEARAELERARGTNRDEYRASRLLAEGLIERYTGRPQLAVKLLEEAGAQFRAKQEIQRAIFADSHRAMVLLDNSEFAAAEALFAQAEKEADTLRDSLVRGQISLGLARAMKLRGARKEALQLYLGYFHGIEELARGLQTDEGRSSALSEHEALFEEIVQLAFDLARESGDYSQARAIAERARNQGLTELAADALIEPHVPGQLVRTGELEYRPESWAKPVMQMAPTIRSHTERRSAEEPVEGTISPETPPTLEYYSLSSRTLIFLRKGGTTQGASIELPRAELEKMVEKYRTVLGLQPDSRGGYVLSAKAKQDRERPAAIELYDFLISPVANALPAAGQTIAVVPDGPLWRLPFAALLDKKGRRLVESHPLTYAVSASGLSAGIARERRRDGKALIFGNPNTKETRGCSGEQLSWPQLPGAESEARAIAARFAERAVLRTGGETTPLLLEAWHDDFSVLHFAVHGYACAAEPLDSFLVLGEYDPKNWNLVGTKLMEWAHPGAPAIEVDEEESRRFTKGLWPGFLKYEDKLSARKIFANYRLKADLVMLSACDTGLGKISAEGAVGFARAFIASGARTIGLSLWPVPDEPTKYLMDIFYENYLRDGDKARALQAAMLATEQKYSSTVAWAGFVLLGAPN